MWNLLKEIDQTLSTVLSDLNKAAEQDEIDTITFGLETDDGNIVKVYVQSDQADKFEEELSQSFGKEDDIEKVLNELAKKYNIVDVIWPDEDIDVTPDDQSSASADDDLDVELSDGSESQTEFADEKEDKSKTKIKKETFGSKFAEKYLAEAEAKKTMVKDAGKGSDKDDEESDDIIIDETTIKFTNANQRLVYDMIQLLGIDPYIIRQRRMHFIKSIRNTALTIQRDSRMRNLLVKLRTELEGGALQEAAEVAIDTKYEEQLMNVNSKRIRSILTYLGVTNDDFKFWWQKTRKTILAMARNMNTAPRARYLINQIYARITQEELDAEELGDKKKRK